MLPTQSSSLFGITLILSLVIIYAHKCQRYIWHCHRVVNLLSMLSFRVDTMTEKIQSPRSKNQETKVKIELMRLYVQTAFQRFSKLCLIVSVNKCCRREGYIMQFLVQMHVFLLTSCTILTRCNDFEMHIFSQLLLIVYPDFRISAAPVGGGGLAPW